MQIVLMIIAVAKAVPVINNWIQLLLVTFTNAQIDKMSKENRDAIKKAIEGQDQRDLETAMGSTKVGLPSGIPGTEIRDNLPGVK